MYTLKKWLVPLAGVCLFGLFLAMTWLWFDKDELKRLLTATLQEPYWLVLMFAVYWLSFGLKAIAWRAYAGSADEPLRIYYHGIIYSLLVNHLSPVKVGDLVRAGFLMKAASARWDRALHSVAAMRALDMLMLGTIACGGLLWLGLPASWVKTVVLLAAGVALLALYRLPAVRRLPFIGAHLTMLHETMLSAKGLLIVLAVAVSWVLEAGVLYGIAKLASLELGVGTVIWANSVTIAGQVVHVTPGGIGTYESTLSGSLAALGIGWKEAYAAAVWSHMFKFLFSFGVGAYSVIRMPIGWKELSRWFMAKPSKPPEAEAPPIEGVNSR
ncbi:lysylphosphatidylglycerol synthase transmembrane domain-containing protein [Paenibacillus koleovorans]|uniref:lysylphosphatidylglycerol synthase transmembrane domain-containing protein n=1 Tax=Paenibacillus koleovorans TaxID=121608 RepID=UPI000FDAF58F|nr:lysylphosphatidylglycerol synthase transmembrane domain-containing protein [Paenibacillus koleovorans]